MGNSVNINPLTIAVLNPSPTYSDDLQMKPSLFNTTSKTSIEFPFYLAIGQRNTIEYRKQKQIQKSNVKLLYKCSISGFSNIVVENLEAREESRIWKLVQQNQNVAIQPDDCWKIPKLEMKLKYLVNQTIPQAYQYGLNFQNDSHKNCDQSSRMSNGSGVWKCKVCFQGSDVDFNPLISLCKCEGSIKFIHFKCLKNWVSKKVKQIEQPNCTIYEYASLICELCKYPLQTHFWKNDRFFSLIQKQQIQAPYAIIESKNPLNRSQKITSYRVKLNQGLTVTLGRSGQSDIPVKCSAVSRKHCLLYYTHKQLFIKDLKSKYGTFVYSKNAQYDFNLQSGLIFSLKESKIQIKCVAESFLSLHCCKAIDRMKIKIIDESDEKFTVETSWEMFDFLQ